MRDRLDDVAPRTRDAVREVFEAASGELIIDDEGAPERADFDSYEAWLIAAHSWAVDELQDTTQALNEATAGLHLSADGYPGLGDNRPEAVATLENVQDDLEDAAELLEAVAAADRRLAKIEAAYAEL
jgi:hypothetical protein